MTRALALLVLLVAASGCKRDRTPQRTATKIPQRTATKQPGFDIAGDPTPQRPLSEIFATATWLRIDPGAGPEGAPELVDPPRLAETDGKFGRHVLAIKKAAFGTHVVRLGESAPIDDDDLAELAIERPSHVYLLGAARPCVATAGTSRAVVLDALGRELELRHALLGCGTGPHAPIGFVTERVPLQLGWQRAQCDDSSWSDAEAAVAKTAEAPARVGVVMYGDAPVLHVFASDEALLLAIAVERGAPIVRTVPDLDPRALAVRCPGDAG